MLFGDFEYDTAQKLLSRKGVPIKIQPQPLKVLAALLERPGEIVTREELRASIWGEGTFIEFDQSLNYCVRQIRIALGEGPADPVYVETLPKQGYRFIFPIHAETIASVNLDGVETKTIPSRDFRKQISWAALALCLVGLASWVAFRWNQSHMLAEVRSIVVLPFTNNTGNPNLDYLANGFTSELIRRIAMVPGLKVIGINSSLAVMGKKMSSVEAARQFGVGTVLTGSIKGSDQDLAVELEVTNGQNGTVILNRSYKQGPTNLAAMQTILVTDIAQSLDRRLGNEDRKKQLAGLTDNPQAFDLYLKAQTLTEQPNPPGLHKAIELYSAAIKKDAQFAVALSQMAAAHMYLGLYFEDPREHMPLAKTMSLRALAIDDSLAEAHGNLGLVALTYDWDYHEAQRQLILTNGRMNPAAIQILACSTHLMSQTVRSVNADQEMRQVLSVNPLSAGLWGELGCTAYYRRQYELALQGYKRALTMQPDLITAIWGLGKSYGQMGQYQQALDSLEQSPKPHGMYPAVILGEMGYASAKKGDKKSAFAALDNLRQMATQTYVDPYFRAQIHHALGDTPATLAALEEAYKVHSSILIAIHSDPKWDDLQHNLKFLELEHRIGF